MKKSTINIIRISTIVALGGFLMGFDASVISGVVKFIEPQFQLSKIELGWAVSCLTLTSTLAMILSGPLSDRFGRRIVLKYAAILYALSALASAIAPSFWFLVAARMIGGFGVGASLIIAPMYIAEISPQKIRGTMVSFNQLNIVIGISAAFFSNYLILKLGDQPQGWLKTLGLDEYNWRWMLGIETFPAVLYYIFLFFVPESPRWLALRGQEDKAIEILSNVSSREEALNTLSQVKASTHESPRKIKTPWNELFKPSMKLVLFIGLVVAITQQITGINAVFFYAPMIFEQTGVGTDAAFSQAILVGLTNLVFTVLAMWMIDRIGRRRLLIIGLSGIVLSMGLLTYGFGKATYQLSSESVKEICPDADALTIDKISREIHTSEKDYKAFITDLKGAKFVAEHENILISHAIHINPWMILMGIVGFVASFAISIGPVMWVLFSELFPNKIRGLAISFTGFVNSAVSFLVQLVFPWELANLGSSATFFIYGVFALIGLWVVFFYLPETKGKSLEELESILIK